jgi:hypothetical protein
MPRSLYHLLAISCILLYVKFENGLSISVLGNRATSYKKFRLGNRKVSETHKYFKRRKLEWYKFAALDQKHAFDPLSVSFVTKSEQSFHVSSQRAFNETTTPYH